MAAETIRLAAGVGLVGGSVEDATGDKDRPLYDISQVRSAWRPPVEAAREAAVLLHPHRAPQSFCAATQTWTM